MPLPPGFELEGGASPRLPPGFEIEGGGPPEQADPGFLSSAFDNTMGAVGKAFSVFSYPLNALGRGVARAEGIPVRDEDTLGTMLRGAAAPSEQFTKEHPLAGGLAKGALEFTGDTLASGPLMALGTAKLPAVIGKAMTALFAAGAVNEAKHLYQAWQSGDQEALGKALAGTAGFAAAGYGQHKLTQFAHPEAVAAPQPPKPVMGEQFAMTEPPFGPQRDIATRPFNEIPKSEVSTNLPEGFEIEPVYDQAISRMREVTPAEGPTPEQALRHFTERTEARMEAPSNYYDEGGVLRTDLSTQELQRLWEGVAQTYPEKYPTGYDSMRAEQNAPPEIAERTLGNEMAIKNGKRTATQEEIGRALKSQKGELYNRFLERFREGQQEAQPPAEEMIPPPREMVEPVRGVDERPVEAGEELAPGAESFDPAEFEPPSAEKIPFETVPGKGQASLEMEPPPGEGKLGSKVDYPSSHEINKNSKYTVEVLGKDFSTESSIAAFDRVDAHRIATEASKNGNRVIITQTEKQGTGASRETARYKDGARVTSASEWTRPSKVTGSRIKSLVPQNDALVERLAPEMEKYLGEARAKPQYKRLEQWVEQVSNAVQEVIGGVIPDLAKPRAYLNRFSGGAYDPGYYGANHPSWMYKPGEPAANTFHLNLWNHALDSFTIKDGLIGKIGKAFGYDKVYHKDFVDKVIDTVLHELAHNVPGAGHDTPHGQALFEATHNALRKSPEIQKAIEPFRESLLAAGKARPNGLSPLDDIIRTVQDDAKHLEKLLGETVHEETGTIPPLEPTATQKTIFKRTPSLGSEKEMTAPPKLGTMMEEAFSKAKGEAASEANIADEPAAMQRKALVEQQKLALGGEKNPFAYDLTRGRGLGSKSPEKPVEAEGEAGRGPITASDYINVPRSLMTAADLSYVFRQAIIPSIRHPFIAAKALKNSLSAFKDGKVANKLMMEIAATPEFAKNHAEGLHWTKHDGATPEEAFYGSRVIREWFKKLDAIHPGAEKWNVVEASERSFTYFLNKMRQDIHNYNKNQLTNLGFKEGHYRPGTEDWVAGDNDEVFRAAAKWANNVTGRGDYPKGPGYVRETLRSSQGLLNAIMFSPRMMISRMTILNPKTYYDYFSTAKRSSGSAGKAAQATMLGPVLDMATFLAVASGVTMATAAAVGGSVEKDPRSSDFMKLKVGNTRFDLFGGFQPFVRTAAQFVTNQRKTKYGNIEGTTKEDVMSTFLRGRLAPVPALTVDALAGKDITGGSFWGPTPDVLSGKTPLNAESGGDIAKTLGGQVGQDLSPLAYQDIVKAYQEDPWVGIASVLPSLLGVGVTTHEKLPSSKAQSEFYRKGVSPPMNMNSIRLGENWEGKPVSYKMTFEEAKKLRESTDPQIYRTLEQIIDSPQYKQLSSALQKILLAGAVREMNQFRSKSGKMMVPPPKMRSLLTEGSQALRNESAE